MSHEPRASQNGKRQHFWAESIVQGADGPHVASGSFRDERDRERPPSVPTATDLCSTRAKKRKTHTNATAPKQRRRPPASPLPRSRHLRGQPLTRARRHVTAHVLDQAPAKQPAHVTQWHTCGTQARGTSRLLPAGGLGLGQGHAGGCGQAPGTVGVPCQHAVLTAAVLPTEGQGRLDHARVGAGIDKPPALCE